MNEKSSQQKKIQSAKTIKVKHPIINPQTHATAQTLRTYLVNEIYGLSRYTQSLNSHELPQPTRQLPRSFGNDSGKNDNFCKKKRERVLFLFLYLRVRPLTEMINGVEQVFVLL